MVTKKELELLNSSQSWRSPIAVIAHIDLDAFYAQCLGVNGGYDPAEPLGCRQWNSLIAINYPARAFGLKRGVSCSEALKLCPQIHLPHVATFKKGEQEWKFHEHPNPNTYKVSLDFFRRESRKIFSVFKQNFKTVEKAGIDEAFIDLGKEVYEVVYERYKDKLAKLGDDEDVGIEYNELIDIGADLVKSVRLQIHAELKYTCSAGISVNKQISKLASAYKKPFNQTVVYKSNITQFLAEKHLTDIWGWGGKTGQQALAKLGISEDQADQCGVIRQLELGELQRKLDYKTASSLYSTVRGEYISEIKKRTLPKSMVAVKDFRKLQALESFDDVKSWLEVFSADLAGRLQDFRDDLNAVIVPRTISMKQYRSGLQSRQKPFKIRGTDVASLQREIKAQANEIAADFIALPCVYLTVDLTGLYELPKTFSFQQPKQNLNQESKLELKPELKLSEPAIEPTDQVIDLTSEGEVIESSQPNENDEAGKNRKDYLPIDEIFKHNETNETLPASSPTETNYTDGEWETCSKCGSKIALKDVFEHEDWHFAKELASEPVNEPASEPDDASKTEHQPKKTKSNPKSNPKTSNQRSILEFMKR